jgi:release factor glutamine methyltransferase
MTLGDALAAARQRIPASEARLLLQDMLGATAADLAAHPDRPMSDAHAASYSSLIERRAAGEPVAYLIGRREFYGREFVVSSAVLIPRPETELLVETGAAKLRGLDHARVLDLGAGSGCVAITLALETRAQVVAVDVSAAALAVARQNAGRLGAHVDLLESDWFSSLAGRFELIVANPPYIAEGDPHLVQGDLRFEPAGALACGADGLSAIRRIVAGAPAHLNAEGWLFFEHGYDQAHAVRELLDSAGFTDIEQHRDLAGIVRVSGGRLTRTASAP